MTMMTVHFISKLSGYCQEIQLCTIKALSHTEVASLNLKLKLCMHHLVYYDHNTVDRDIFAGKYFICKLLHSLNFVTRL